MKTRTSAMQRRESKSRNVVESEGKVDEQLMKVGLAVIGVSSCVIGIWAAVSLISGMMASGGPLPFLENWIRAVIG